MRKNSPPFCEAPSFVLVLTRFEEKETEFAMFLYKDTKKTLRNLADSQSWLTICNNFSLNRLTIKMAYWQPLNEKKYNFSQINIFGWEENAFTLVFVIQIKEVSSLPRSLIKLKTDVPQRIVMSMLGEVKVFLLKTYFLV